MKQLSGFIMAYFHENMFFHLISIHSLFLITLHFALESWLCRAIYYWKCLTQKYFMHILLQLISRKTPVFFISDENSGWLPISLLLIIFFSFDLDYDCSVRRTHLFISFAWWDGLFGRLHRLMHIKNGFRGKLESCESAHMAVAFWLIYLFISVCL